MMRWLIVLSSAALLLGVAPAPATASGRFYPAVDGLTGRWIVEFVADLRPVDELVRVATTRREVRIDHVYRSVLRGFAATMDEATARQLAAHPLVAAVRQDREMRAQGTQQPVPSWGVDRMDQPNLPLDNTYTYRVGAPLVHTYVIDSGIRLTHQDLGGRATWGINLRDGNNSDCSGHGTHLAGTVGGSMYGVAKGVRLVGVKVLDCAGSGSVATMVAGIDWVATNAVRPAVALLAVSSSSPDVTVDNAVRRLIAGGVPTVVAAGNSNADACTVSPARVPEAITVGASTITDARASFSNWGVCVDQFAPGQNITAPWIGSDFATNTTSGTSVAAAHVTGAVAQWFAIRPGATAAEVMAGLRRHAVPRITNPGTGSPNLLTTVPPRMLPVLTQPRTGAGVVGQAFDLAPFVTGGVPPFSWSATGLPPGVTINSTTGHYSGTPTTAGRYLVGLTVTDAAARADQLIMDLLVRAPGAPTSQVVAAPSFEAGPDPQAWSATAGVLGQTVHPPRTGLASAWLGGTGRFHRDWIAQSVAVPAGTGPRTLSFWTHIETSEWAIGSEPDDVPLQVAYKPNPEDPDQPPLIKPPPGPWPFPGPWPPCPCPPPDWWDPLPDPLDRLLVEIAGPLPNPWQTLDVLSNFDAAAGYQFRSYDVSAHAGTTITLRFTVMEDDGSTTTFVTDDVTVHSF